MADDLLKDIRAGDRRSLARAMTLVESTRDDHRREAEELLSQLDTLHTPSIRIGISGNPGVGKSTFIEALGSYIISLGHKVAVLAIDPTSPLTQGSILADKTRMPILSSSPEAFIRPSPTAGTLGGVASKTRETVALCEAAGFDIILIETVGVGQSEVAVKNLTDMVILLLPPAGGDDLQGIKKGIVEIADLILVNKCDGELETAAKQAASHYTHTLTMLGSKHKLWEPPVQTISALTNQGVDTVWKHVCHFQTVMLNSDAWVERREKQQHIWFEDALKEEVWCHFEAQYREDIKHLKTSLEGKSTTPVASAHSFVHARLGKSKCS